MSEHQKKKTVFRKISKALLPLMFLLAGGGAMAYFKATAPTMTRAPAKKTPTLVQVLTAAQGEVTTVVSAMGTVVPFREVTVKARVSGEIAWVSDNFVPGGCIAENERILSLDPSEHEISVQKAQSALDDAKAALDIEKGNQTIAREEIRLLSELALDEVQQTDLALRKPQLKQAEAAVVSAEADLRQAELDLSHTVIKAPFNAVVVERNVNLGTYVSAQESLTTLVSTDEFWVEAVVPLDQLSLIDIHQDGGCPAVIRSQVGQVSRQARVVRIAGKLNETSRMATVILAVPDPLGLKSDTPSTGLIIDDYVFADITGRALSNVIGLPRSALRDGNTVWVYENDSLAIRSVTLVWKTADKVYIRDGLASGDQVVVSDISSPVNGMPLTLAESKEEIARNE